MEGGRSPTDSFPTARRPAEGGSGKSTEQVEVQDINEVVDDSNLDANSNWQDEPLKVVGRNLLSPLIIDN